MRCLLRPLAQAIQVWGSESAGTLPAAAQSVLAGLSLGRPRGQPSECKLPGRRGARSKNYVMSVLYYVMSVLKAPMSESD